METVLYKLNNDENDNKKIEKAANYLRNGKTVIFPTETVYGLGANALDSDAAKKIYTAKGRPSDNPLIVHIYDKNQVYELATNINKKAKIIMDKFWPGPITIVLEKKDIVPDTTSGGLDTVAIRMPMSKVAREIIKRANIPIAAPSANISGRPSPTRAKHVIKEMMGRVDLILSGDNCDFGLESTVVDFTGQIPILLRPGSITVEQLEKEIGNVKLDPSLDRLKKDAIAKSPGMKYKHYSPNADVYIVRGKEEDVIKEINSMLKLDKQNGLSSGVICINSRKLKYNGLALGLGEDLKEVASNLFDSLIEMDNLKLDKVYAESFSKDGVGRAIMNRLLKAAGYKIIYAKKEC